MMFNLFFGDTYSILTTIMVIAASVFAYMVHSKSFKNLSWGKSIAVFIILGLAVSFLSAMRDGYAGDAALFSMSSIQSDICSVAGGLIMLAGLLSLFVRKDIFRKAAFIAITVLFALQVLIIEVSRISMLV